MLPSLTTGSQGNTAQRPLLAKPTKPPPARVMRSRPVESWNGLTGVRPMDAAMGSTGGSHKSVTLGPCGSLHQRKPRRR